MVAEKPRESPCGFSSSANFSISGGSWRGGDVFAPRHLTTLGNANARVIGKIQEKITMTMEQVLKHSVNLMSTLVACEFSDLLYHLFNVHAQELAVGLAGGASIQNHQKFATIAQLKEKNNVVPVGP